MITIEAKVVNDNEAVCNYAFDETGMDVVKTARVMGVLRKALKQLEKDMADKMRLIGLREEIWELCIANEMALVSETSWTKGNKDSKPSQTDDSLASTT